MKPFLMILLFFALSAAACGSEAKPPNSSTHNASTVSKLVGDTSDAPDLPSSAPTNSSGPSLSRTQTQATSTPAHTPTTVPPTNSPVPATAVAPTATRAVPTPVPPTAAPPTPVPPTATKALPQYQLPGCYQAGKDTCNCPHFSTQAYAQWFHNNYDPTDKNKLDNDGDGTVCESNP